MNRLWLPLAGAIIALAGAVRGEESIVVGSDGAISGLFTRGAAAREAVVFRFGLPTGLPSKQWREGRTLRTLWETNGVKYTQTVLLCRSGPRPLTPALSHPMGEGDSGDKESTSSTEPMLLLVNIEGENTNKEYADASAQLSAHVQDQQQQLELKEGLIWRRAGAENVLIGALVIPESGIKSDHGDVLRFGGGMPPSLKGSMTVKLLLKSIPALGAVDRLEEIDFDDEFRRARAVRSDTPIATEGVVVVFPGEAGAAAGQAVRR